LEIKSFGEDIKEIGEKNGYQIPNPNQIPNNGQPNEGKAHLKYYKIFRQFFQ
jgi:hypothetical protein